MWSVISMIFRTPMRLAKGVFASPMGIFIYGILSKWYITVMLGSVIVTFWVFKGLEKSGVLSATFNVVYNGLEQTKAVAQHCTPLIANLQNFWDCVSNVPTYVPTEEEKALYKQMHDVEYEDPAIQHEDPYSQEDPENQLNQL